METSSDFHLDKRRALSRQSLVGKGIEQGAVHNPLWGSERGLSSRRQHFYGNSSD